MELHQIMDRIQTQSDVSRQDIETAASLLLTATHENKFWQLIKALRQATDKEILPNIAGYEVQGELEANSDLQPYILSWRELDREIMAVWNGPDGFLSRFLPASNVRSREEILRLYSRYLYLDQTDEVEFQRHQESIIASVLKAYNLPRETLTEVLPCLGHSADTNDANGVQ